jgi:hypothetical protein
MAKGRLRSTTVPAYSAAEIYHNSSSDEASITIHGQVISETENSKISVGATSVNYTSTIITSSTSTNATVGPYDCLLAVNSCDNTGETYNGYSMNTRSNICLSAYNPSYVNTGGTAYCKGYAITQATCNSSSPCCWAACFEHYGLQFTMVHPKVLSKYGKGRFIGANYSCTAGTGASCLVLACYGCHNDDVVLKLNSCLNSVASCFTHASNAEVYATCGDCMPTAWYIDLWTCRTFMIGHRRKTPGAGITCASCACEIAMVLCGCGRSMAPGCVCLNSVCTVGAFQSGTFLPCINSFAILANPSEHYSKGPLWGGGCDVYFAHDMSAITTGINSFYLKSIENLKALGQPQLVSTCCIITKICTCCQYELSTCGQGRPIKVTVDPGDTGARYPIKWFAYNPIVKCHFFMIHNGGLDDGIYKVDNTTLAQCAACNLETGTGRYYFCTTVATAPITKVGDVPAAFTNHGGVGDLCYGRLYQSDFCYYSMPVNNGTNWSILSSTDLVNWASSRDDVTCCYVQLTTSGNRTYASSGGSGICLVSNNYDTCIDVSGTIDYKVEANQYQQNGIVLSSGDRLYAKNEGNNATAFNVWGYEG